MTGGGGIGGVCVSLKARPLPLPKCEMLRLGDAGLLLFVRPLQLRDPGQKVIAAFRGQKHAALLQSSLSYIDIYKISDQLSPYPYHISLIFAFFSLHLFCKTN